MKYPKINSIEWHEENLKNHVETLNQKEEELNRLTKEVVKNRQAVSFHHKQIQEAKKQGKEKFDSQRFLVKRK